jgi:probable phosphoglycerate mutase
MPHRPTTPNLFANTPVTPKPASKDWISAHCDGGARGNPGPAGYGALIQDANGMVLAELSEFLGIRTNNYAEYSGLLGCLQYALDHGHPRLRVVSDSELMVKQIQGKYKVNSPDLKPLWQEARNRIAKLEAFEISHALRHKNKDADRLANEAMDRGMKRPHTPATSAPAPLKATPYPTKSEAPPNPYAKADTMLRGFTKDGVIHILGNATLPEGIFVKIIRE